MNQNYEAWLDYLDTAKEPQAHDALMSHYDKNGEPQGQPGYCCLGIACKIAGDLGKPYIENDGQHVLLPIVVADWLGLEEFWTDRTDDYGTDWTFRGLMDREPDKGVDIFLDWPEEYPLPNGFDSGDNNMTASWLNDNNLTFREIADCLRYFGIEKVSD